MLNLVTFFLTLMSLLICFTECCNIKAVLHISKQDKNGFAQFTFHNETKSQVYKIRTGEEERKETFMISGPNCNTKPTILETFEKEPSASSSVKGSTSAFIEGQGSVQYEISNHLVPSMTMRLGVGCAFGDCGRG